MLDCENNKNLYADAINRIKNNIKKRCIFLEQVFRSIDTKFTGLVTSSEMRPVILITGTLLSQEEYETLEDCYNDEHGFDYISFLRDVDPDAFPISECLKCKNFHDPNLLCCPAVDDFSSVNQLDPIWIIAKIKGNLKRKNLSCTDISSKLCKYIDEQFISACDFRDALQLIDESITDEQSEILNRVFKSPTKPCAIDYKMFCEILESVPYDTCIDTDTIISKCVTSSEGLLNFLNFAERVILWSSMRKICYRQEYLFGIGDEFKKYDSEKLGTITRIDLSRILVNRGLIDLISSREFDIIWKAFSIEQNFKWNFDYTALLKAAERLKSIKKLYPF